MLSVVLIFPLFFVGGPSETSRPVYRAIWNLGHIGFFAIVTAILLERVPRLRPDRGLRSLLTITAAVLAVGIMIEVLQYGTSREPDLHDIWRNLLGCWLVWAWGLGKGQGRPGALAVLGLCLTFEFFLIGKTEFVDWQIQHQLPVVSELEHQRDLEQWSGEVELSHDFAAFGKASLKVQLDTDLYSGATLNRLPEDWRGFRWLKFAVYNPDADALQLTLRINDKKHEHGDYRYQDRFNTRLTAQPGWNHFAIDLDQVRSSPADREMEMGNIFKVVIFAVRLPAPRVIYLDDFRLE